MSKHEHREHLARPALRPVSIPWPPTGGYMNRSEVAFSPAVELVARIGGRLLTDVDGATLADESAVEGTLLLRDPA